MKVLIPIASIAALTACGGGTGDTAASFSSSGSSSGSSSSSSGSDTLPAGVWIATSLGQMISDDSGAFFAAIVTGVCSPIFSGTLSVAADSSVSGSGYDYINPYCEASTPVSFTGTFSQGVLHFTGASVAGGLGPQGTWIYQPAMSMPTALSALAGSWLASDGTAISVNASGQVTGDCTGQITNDDPEVNVFSITLATCTDAGVGLATLDTVASTVYGGASANLDVWTQDEYLTFVPQ
jgi:hypothetical protein